MVKEQQRRDLRNTRVTHKEKRGKSTMLFNPNKYGSQRGLTLAELTVGLGLLAVVALVGNALITNLSQSQASASSRQTLRLVTERMERLIENDFSFYGDINNLLTEPRYSLPIPDQGCNPAPPGQPCNNITVPRRSILNNQDVYMEIQYDTVCRQTEQGLRNRLGNSIANVRANPAVRCLTHAMHGCGMNSLPLIQIRTLPNRGFYIQQNAAAAGGLEVDLVTIPNNVLQGQLTARRPDFFPPSDGLLIGVGSNTAPPTNIIREPITAALCIVETSLGTTDYATITIAVGMADVDPNTKVIRDFQVMEREFKTPLNAGRSITRDTQLVPN